MIPIEIARELADAYSNRQILPAPLTQRDPSFDLSAAYAVEAELVRLRRASGRVAVGRKVGYANRAMWRVLGLETLVWAHMYDDTVRFADGNATTLALGGMCAPKIEPEIVVKIRTPLAEATGAPEVLDAVEWIALGFEIIDCVFADWKFQPPDFVASFGLHAALIVGEPRPLDRSAIPILVEQLSRFKVQLLKDGELVAEGSGRNSLRSPALCVGELATAIVKRTPDAPLAVGELVSTGTLTDSQAIAPGQSWSAIVDGIDLPELVLRLKA